MLKNSWGYRKWLAPALAVFTVGLASVGISSSPGASAATTGGQPPSLATAGKAAGLKLGTIKLPKKTVGYLRYVGASAGDQRIYNGATAAFKVLGWKVITCDGQGTPTIILQCGNTLLADRPNVIVENSIPVTYLATVIKKAKAEHIPIVNIGGTVPQQNEYSATYAPNDTLLGNAMSTWLGNKLASLPQGQRQIIDQTFIGTWATARVAALNAHLNQYGETILTSPQADGMNLVAGTQSQMASLLTSYPTVKAIWITFDAAVQGAAQAVQTAYAGKTFPNAPLLVTFYAELPTLSLIANGDVSATVEGALEVWGWIAADQLAQYFSHHAALSKSTEPNYKGLGNYAKLTMVTQSNLPLTGQLVPPPVNYQSYFKAKWKAQFGRG